MSLTDRVGRLLGEQPWPGCDEQDVGAIATRLDHGDADAARQVKRYERDRKDRAGVVHVAERRIGPLAFLNPNFDRTSRRAPGLISAASLGSAPVPTILLVRHGQSSFGGAEYDVLSDLGASQAVALAEALAVRGVRVERVVSGSLARQRDTAAPIAAAGACPVAVDPRWDEYDANDILEAHSTTAARLDRPSGSDAPPVSAREFQDILDSALSAWIAAGAASSTRETWPAFAHRVGAALADLAVVPRVVPNAADGRPV